MKLKKDEKFIVILRDDKYDEELFKYRALQGFILVIIFFIILIANLYYLQIISFKDFNERSHDNRIRIVPIPPNRGLIFDRNGEVLAENVNSYDISIIPEKIKNMQEFIDNLKKIIDISEDEEDNFFKSLKGHSKFKPLILRTNLSELEVSKFSVDKYMFDGAQINSGLTRNYPYNELLTHVIGYIGKINQNESNALKKDNDMWKNYRATKTIGKLGIEKYYESTLHGTVGYREEEVNNRGRVINVLNEQPPIAGKNLYLTIDIKLQEKAMELLKGNRGVIIAIDPRNGEILTMASNPSYDPNPFIRGISHKEYNKLLNDNSKPLINRATKGVYPPASTVKPFLALLGLEEKVIDVNTKIKDPGYWQIPNVARKYNDWKRFGHGNVDLFLAISESCDVYFYDLGYKLGIDRIHGFMTKFGFGSKTGVDIAEETAGIMPNKTWKKGRSKKPDQQLWYIGDTISVAIGQGYWSVTPLQLTRALTILANHGVDYKPHLVHLTKNKTENSKIDIIPSSKINLNDPNNWNIIGEAMFRTASHSLFKSTPYKAAMKTGTAQVYSVKEGEIYDSKTVQDHLRDNALIVAYAPYEAPTIAFTIILENAGFGGRVAGPIAKDFLDFYMQQKDKRPN